MRRLLGIAPVVVTLLCCSGSKAVGPDQAVQDLLKALDQGRAEALWDALPASYQADIDSLRILFAQRMDRELYERGFALIGKLMTVLRTKGEFIRNHPMAQALPLAKVDAQEWDSALAGAEAFFKSELATLDGLRSMNIRQFLAKSGGRMVSQGVKLNLPEEGEQKVQRLTDIQVGLVRRDGDRATLSFTVGSNKEEEEFVRVEGKWIPAELSQAWKPAEWKDAVRGLSITPEQKTQALMAMSMVETVLDQLQKASTQEEFNGVLGGVLGPLGGMQSPLPQLESQE